MERLSSILAQAAPLGLSENGFISIVLGVLGLVGTIATVVYRYKGALPKEEKEDNVLFTQLNAIVEQQRKDSAQYRADRDSMRKELQEVREELEEVRADNRLKDLQIDKLIRDNNELRIEVEELMAEAKKLKGDDEDVVQI